MPGLGPGVGCHSGRFHIPLFSLAIILRLLYITSSIEAAEELWVLGQISF